MTHILACIDGSTASRAVTEAAIWASRRLRAPLELLHVLEKPERPAAGDLSGSIGFGAREHLLEELVALEEKKSRLELEHGKAMLEAAREHALSSGAQPVTTRQLHGSLPEILSEREDEIRLCILGRQGESHPEAHRTIGSNIETVTRTLKSPVLLVPSDFRPPESFMIAFDGSKTAWKALETVAGSPLLSGVPCHVVMAGKAADTRQEELSQACDKLTEKGFSVTDVALEGSAAEALGRYRREQRIGLLVMGAYGHARIRQFLVGSTTTRMLVSSEVPLLILR